MRLIELPDKFETKRVAAGSQALAAKQMFGSQGGPEEVGGKGSRIAAIEELEGSGAVGTNGKGGPGDMKRHPTLSELKRWLYATYGGGDGARDNSVYSLLGRD